MKPIWRLRMRARSANDRFATSVPLSAYLPAEGVSSSPRIDSKVVLPQPDGPAMETYSPGRMSRWIPDSAWVSTSSVRKHFVTLFSRIRGSDPLFMFELLIVDY